jgi:hypothetical protein
MQCCDQSQWRENHRDRSIHLHTLTTVSMGKKLRREMQIFKQREKKHSDQSLEMTLRNVITKI